MNLYLINGRGYFGSDAPEDLSGGTLTIRLFPAQTCDGTVGDTAIRFEDGIAKILADALRPGINAFRVGTALCEEIIRRGNSAKPLGMSARGLVESAYQTAELERRVEKIEQYFAGHFVDPLL